MKVGLFLDGDCYNKDAIFDDSSGNWLNHDKLLHVWLNMRNYLTDRGIEIHTYDVYPDLDAIDKAVFFGLYSPNNELLSRMRSLGKDCYYVAYEPPVIHHWNARENLVALSSEFRKILTHQDDLIDNRKFFRLTEGKVLPDMSGVRDIPFAERYFMLAMNSYRYANFDTYREIYSERFRASRFFEQVSDQFHIYGRGLNDPERIKARWGHKKPIHFNSYVGEIKDKMAVMCRYKYHLCFENCTGVYGYISEKIIHSFLAGVVPVYWGPVNPTDYFPQDTFVDVRVFSDYRDLHKYLTSVSEKGFNRYREAIRAYLASEQYEKFFGKDVFGRTIYELITDTCAETHGVPAQASAEQSPVMVREQCPRISILVPTRNRAKLLTESLACLAKQDYPSLEVVVVDDCSSDDTPAVVEQHRSSIRNLIYHRNRNQMGPALAFRRAAELSSGDYLLNFSDDDLLADNAVFAYVAPLTERPYDLIYSDLAIIDDTGKQSAVWKYNSYTTPMQLVRALVDAGGNVIPEVLLVRREIYDGVYGELYSKRFITPFFLSAMRQLSMRHIPSPLYKYRIHQQSTFHDNSGLITRNKGVTNFLNLIMFNFDPVEVFQTVGTGDRSRQIADAITKYVLKLLEHAARFVQGTFYTGNSYTEQDMLWGIYYEYVSHWLDMRRKYGSFDPQVDKLAEQVSARLVSSNYNPVTSNNLPDIYSTLPWFSYKPLSPVTDFVALDVVTLGRGRALTDGAHTLINSGTMHVTAANRVFSDIGEFREHIERLPLQVLVVTDPDLLEAASTVLVDSGRVFAHVVNATGSNMPSCAYMLRHTVDIAPSDLTDIQSLLAHLTISDRIAHIERTI